jgi:hypothetical protein
VTDKVIIPVHRFILAARSPVLKTIFTSEPQKQELAITEFPLEVVRAFIRYLYGGTVEKNILDLHAEPLFLMADQYRVPGLMDLCENQLVGKLTDDNAVRMLRLADEHNALSLKKDALQHSLKQVDRVDFMHPVINEHDLPTYDKATQSCTGFANVKFDRDKIYSRKLLSIDLVIDRDQNYELCIVDDETKNRKCYPLANTITVAVSAERLVFYPVYQPPVAVWPASSKLMKEWLQTLHCVTSLANLRAKGLRESKSAEDLNQLAKAFAGKLPFYSLKNVPDRMTKVTEKNVIMRHFDRCVHGGNAVDYAVNLTSANDGKELSTQQSHIAEAAEAAARESPKGITNQDDEVTKLYSRLKRSHSSAEFKAGIEI